MNREQKLARSIVCPSCRSSYSYGLLRLYFVQATPHDTETVYCGPDDERISRHSLACATHAPCFLTQMRKSPLSTNHMEYQIFVCARPELRVGRAHGLRDKFPKCLGAFGKVPRKGNREQRRCAPPLSANQCERTKTGTTEVPPSPSNGFPPPHFLFGSPLGVDVSKKKHLPPRGGNLGNYAHRS